MGKSIMLRKALIAGVALLMAALPLLGACAKEVVKEVPVEKVVEKEVVREVPVEKVVEKEVVREVPVEKVVVKEVPVLPKPQGELRFSTTFTAFTPDPMLTRNTQKPFMTFIFDWLVGKTPDGKLSTETGIATKWEVSPDGLIHTFYLRDGVKFHNGDNLTAEDVKFSLDRVMSKDSVSGYKSLLEQYIKSVEIADPYKVIVHTKVPAPDLELVLSAVMGPDACIVPKKYIEEKGSDYFVQHPVGSGPYKAVEVVVGSHIKLEAVDTHWRIGIPKYKTIMLMHVPEEATRIAQLKRNETDIIGVSSERAAEIRQAGFTVYRQPGGIQLGAYLLEQWDKDSPLADKRVREALAIGINREEIAKELFAGLAGPLGIMHCSPPDPAYDKALFPPYPYDPAKAKQLLADYGRPVKIKYYAYPRPSTPEILSVGTALAGYWDKLGVKTEIVPIDYASFRNIWLEGPKTGKPALGGGGVGAISLQDPPSRINFFATDQKVFYSDGQLTMTKDPQIDKLMNAAMAAKTLEEMTTLTREWHKYKYDNFLTWGVVEVGALYATNDKIKNWVFSTDEYGFGWDSLITMK